MWYQECVGASGWETRWRTTSGSELTDVRVPSTQHRAALGELGELGARIERTANAPRNDGPEGAHGRNGLNGHAGQNGRSGRSGQNGHDASPHLDPALARAFANAWAGLWVTTGPCQHFYRKEFDLAHKRDARLGSNLAQVEAMLAPTHGHDANVVNAANTVTPSTGIDVDQVQHDIARWLEALSATGDRGWHFRGARDALSLVGNLSLLAIIAACFHQQGTPGDDGGQGADRGASAANTPFGVPWADWTLLAFEGAKGVITQSLGSPTLIRHHAVDEVLKRMDAGCRLLEACATMPALVGTRSISPSISASISTSISLRGALGTLTRARDVATLFTFANSAIPPARLGLWVPSWFSSPPGEVDGYRGILRVAGLLLDSCRAVTSLLGTWARNAAFTLDAQGLTRRWELLCTRLAYVPADDQTAVLRRVASMTQLSAHCDTPLLAKIASHDALREHLLASGESLTANGIASACEQFEVPCHASCVDGASYLSLTPSESPWGHRWTGNAWTWGRATPVRASYRLLLLYQHWSSALLERAVSSLSSSPSSTSTRAMQDGVTVSNDPHGVTRSRAGIAHVDIESTRV